MSDIKLKHLNKTFDKGVVAVSGFDLEIKSGEFVVIVGPSGCGKSTVLRMIAGLENPSAGDVYIGGERVNDVEPKDRDVAMVFQDYALYPNLTVYENLALGLKLRKFDKEEISGRVMSAAENLGITELLSRKPSSLSGGEKQRVALGRVIVRRPKVFLLDEPLSGIDAKFRAEMRKEIVDLHKKTGITFIYVTHDQTEAMTMGGRIVVMRDGRIVQTDTPAVLYDYPNSVFTATFIGMPQMNIIPATLDGGTVNLGGTEVKLPDALASSIFGDANNVSLGVRPEYIRIGEGRFEGNLTALEQTGNETVLYFNAAWKRNMTAVTNEPVTVTAGQTFKFDMDLSRANLFGGEAAIAGIPRYKILPVSKEGLDLTGLMKRHIAGEIAGVGVPPDAFNLDGSISASADWSKAVLLGGDGGVLSSGWIEGPFTKIGLTSEKGRKTVSGIIRDIEFVEDIAVLRIKSGAKEFSAVTDDFLAGLWVGKKIKYSIIH